ELLEQYRKLRPGNVACRDFWYLYIYREDAGRLWWPDDSVNQVAGSSKLARRKPGKKSIYDWAAIYAVTERCIKEDFNGEVPDDVTALANEVDERLINRSIKRPASDWLRTRIGEYLKQRKPL